MSYFDLLPDSVKRKAIGLILILGAVGWFLAAYFAWQGHACP